MPALIVSFLALLLVLWLLGQPYLSATRRQRIRQRPFPDAWQRILQALPCAAGLPPELRARLQGHIQVFIADKAFIGCQGLRINDEIRVTVAAQACLLILGSSSAHYPNLREILVYPDSFVVEHEHTDSIGVEHHSREVLAGESWERGQVVLSWHDTLAGATGTDDGYNVVIHEFAHQLDQEAGSANGAPRLPRREHYARWSEVLGTEFERLRRLASRHEPSLFDDYGASDPAEFFAVISEAFFGQPQRMLTEHPELYRELKFFYRLDPAGWQGASTLTSSQ